MAGRVALQRREERGLIMKKLCLVVALLMIAAPALATVAITCTAGAGADCNLVSLNYADSGEPNKVSGYGLDITVDSGAKIVSVSSLNANYNIYPGSIVITDGVITDYGTPVADKNDPGALGGLGTGGITIEMGALYYPTGDKSLNAPPPAGTLLKFRVDKDCTVTVAENLIRGGIVLTNPSVTPVVTLTGCTVVCAAPDCYPSGGVWAARYADWVTLKKPSCWCAKPIGSGYQCDGDADGLTEGAVSKWRVSMNDLNLIIANWKKKIDDPTLNPCADIDHKYEGAVSKWRASMNDLNIIIANWKMKDTGLPGDCPRP